MYLIKGIPVSQRAGIGIEFGDRNVFLESNFNYTLSFFTSLPSTRSMTGAELPAAECTQGVRHGWHSGPPLTY